MRTFPGRHRCAGGDGERQYGGAVRSCCRRQPATAAEPLGSAKEYYLVRDIDAEPGIVSASQVAQGH